MSEIGRPESPINWKVVEDLLTAGCSGANIAGYIGIERRTLYHRCETDHGKSFTDYSTQFYSKGESLLKAQQFAKAMGKTTEGDNTLLIWLGKVRLKQKEEVSVSAQDLQNISSVVSYLDKMQKDKIDQEAKENNPEAESQE